MKLHKAAFLLYHQEDNASDESKQITEETSHILIEACT
jgi:hypothetical protein